MRDSPSSLPRLFAEMKRRKVFRVMAVYGVIGFGVIEAAEAIFPRVGLPDWTVTLIVWLALLGFPIAVVLAWAFESTADGIKWTEDATPQEISAIVSQPAYKRLPAGLLALAGAALLFGGWWMGARTGPEQPVALDSATSAEAGADTRSVAVLPFVDMSEAGDQEWFADGLAEEILNSLASLPELRVTARTSSFQFRGVDRDIVEIADTLGVAHVLEGSVRRIGSELVVTAQLIRAADGSHLWSDRYERDADDLFDVQRDVAEKVATALDVLLDAERRERMFSSGTRNVEAFEAYLKGAREFEEWHAGDRDSGSDVGQSQFEKALELDPNYGEAALAHADRYTHGFMGDPRVGLSQEESREALLRDLEYAAEHAANPTTRLIAQINAEIFSPTWHRMAGLVEQLAARPDVGKSALLGSQAGWLHHMLVLADNQLARKIATTAVASNPLDQSTWWRLARVELADGNPEAAAEAIERGRRLTGDHPFMRMTLTFISMRDDPVVARRWVESARDVSTDPQNLLLPAYHALGDEAGVASLARRIDVRPDGNVQFMQVIAISGSVPFDLADTPNFANRLNEAGIDLSDFGT